MKRNPREKIEADRAAIYARVSDKSQAEEDKTSISEQISEMEAYCERTGLTIVARYQEVGRGWSKKRPEFQRMLSDARDGRFDAIVCWKSDRLSRGMYPAAVLMEVVEAHEIRLEAVMDAIDLKTFGLMAAIGKIELDNFRERATMGKRGAAKQGRIPTGGLPYGYRIGEGRKPKVVEVEAEVVQRIFRLYVHEGLGIPAIAWRLTDEGVPTPKPGMRWHESQVHRMIGNATYKGTWSYGRRRTVTTEEGTRDIRSTEGDVDRGRGPAAGGRDDLESGPAVEETAVGRLQAEHQGDLPAPAPLQVHRMRTTVQGEGHLGFK